MLSVAPALRPTGILLRLRRTLTSSSDVTAVGDYVLLRSKQDPTRIIFTKPLKPKRRFENQYGAISHDDLIGRRARDIVTFSKGKEFRIHFPTLEEYVTLTPRLVTPIYPADANLIVSLLDIHVSPPESTPIGSTIEILEAGTGHGALTLYLARAIHGANPVPPAPPARSPTDEESSPSAKNGASPDDKAEPIDEAYQLGLQDWKSKRKAVIHTVDVSASHSQAAKRVFCGFRRGMYTGDADFHVGDVSQWIDRQFTARRQEDSECQNQPFLSHAILDMPSSYKRVERVASAMHTDGVLLIFNPSITQITACVELIKNQKLPLVLDRVIEVGAGMSGGRAWDVRAVKPRAPKPKGGETLTKPEGTETEEDIKGKPNSSVFSRLNMEEKSNSTDEEERTATQDDEDVWEMICRPKPAAIFMGGGFIGVWRKMQQLEGRRKD